MKPDFMKCEKEIDQLDRMADKLREFGMEDEARSHKEAVEDLRLRLDKLKQQFFWTSDDEYS